MSGRPPVRCVSVSKLFGQVAALFSIAFSKGPQYVSCDWWPLCPLVFQTSGPLMQPVSEDDVSEKLYLGTDYPAGLWYIQMAPLWPAVMD